MKSRFRQVPVTSSALVPEGFRYEPGLSAIYSKNRINAVPPKLADELRLHRHALQFARQGRMPSYKLMTSTKSVRGRVYLPDDWRQQTIRMLATKSTFCKIPEVQQLRELATSAVPTPAPAVTVDVTDLGKMPAAEPVSEPSPTVKAGQGVQALIDLRDISERHLQMQERIAQQNAQLLAAMHSLLAVWSTPTPN